MRIIDVSTDIQSQKNNVQRAFVRANPEQDKNEMSYEKTDEQETPKKTRKAKRVQAEEV